jgi:FHS family L-fucose permease-like MFS transporter
MPIFLLLAKILSKLKNRPLAILISVFFFWGFVAASNTILLGLFKKNFELTQFQSQLVDWAFYTAYFVGSLIYFLISYWRGDPLNKIGYKKGLIIGLIISAVGALGFIPAEMNQSFPLMLTSLFIIAMGFALQQIVANPYVIALGEPATGSHRVSLAGGINSFGTLIGPLLLAFAVYGSISGPSSFVKTNGVKEQFPVSVERTTGKSEIVDGFISADEPTETMRETNFFKLVVNGSTEECEKAYSWNADKGIYGLVLAFNNDSVANARITDLKTKFPSRTAILKIDTAQSTKLQRLLASNSEVALEVKYYGVDKVLLPSLILAISFLLFAFILGISALPTVSNSEKISGDLGAFKHPQVLLGMLAIFIYVGTEVTTQSNLVEFMRRTFRLEPSHTSHFISLYWGGLMIGRWVGALTVFNLKPIMKKTMTVVVPLIAYSLILFVNYLNGSPMTDILKYFPFVGILIVGFFLAAEKPARTMVLFGLMGAAMITVGILIQNQWSIYCFLSGGLFCSVMWPCIFSLSIAGLGKYTSQASSLLIMMILGGGLIPPMQGRIMDSLHNSYFSYLVPVAGFLFLAWFGWKVKKVLLKQGIDYDKPSEVKSH